MSAPAALAFSKLMQPELESTKQQNEMAELTIKKEKSRKYIFGLSLGRAGNHIYHNLRI